jgi:hypothetical protein
MWTMHDEATARDLVFGAVNAIAQEGAPDDAPPCDERGCDQLGVIPQAVVTPEGTRTWHWCVSHGEET